MSYYSCFYNIFFGLFFFSIIKLFDGGFVIFVYFLVCKFRFLKLKLKLVILVEIVCIFVLFIWLFGFIWNLIKVLVLSNFLFYLIIKVLLV